jgi:hypothetical protein
MWGMSGRRGHQRLTIGGPTTGAVRVLRDVVIERIEHQELVVVSQTPAVIGEELSLELFSASGCIALKVRVLDGRPVVIAGSMRHRLRVVVMTVGAQVTQSNREPLADSPTPPDIA